MFSSLLFGYIWGWLIGIAILITIGMYVLPVVLPIIGIIVALILSGMILSHFAGDSDKKEAAKKGTAKKTPPPARNAEIEEEWERQIGDL